MPSKIHRYIPEGVLPEGKNEPTTVLEALRVGRAILTEEERWTKHVSYKILHPEVDPSTPFCDSWMVCSIGALEVALIGLRRAGEECGCQVCSGNPNWELSPAHALTSASDLYQAAVQELDRTVPDDLGVVGFNDEETTEYEDVLKIWDDTIARLEVAEGTQS